MPSSSAETVPATQEELGAMRMFGREPPGNGPATLGDEPPQWAPLPIAAHAYYYLGEGERSSG